MKTSSAEQLWNEEAEPRLTKSQLESLNEDDLEVLTDALFNYYRRSGYPHYCYDLDEKVEEINKIKRYDYRQVRDNGIVRQTMHGLGLAWSYFPHALDVKVGKMLTPLDVFNDDELLRKALRRRLKRGTYVSHSGIRKGIRTYSGVQSVSNFRPTAAAAIYHTFAPQDAVVWDPSCGYGGRMIGAIVADNIKKYIGTDPCAPTMNGLKQMSSDISGVTNTEVELHQLGSEDFVCNEQVDLCFTSPPYFDTEKYSDEDTQSWVKFQSTNEWNDGFMRQTIKNCKESLKPDGWMVLNVADVSSHPSLVSDVIQIAKEESFSHTTTLQLALSSITKGGYKYEPVLVFKPL